MGQAFAAFLLIVTFDPQALVALNKLDDDSYRVRIQATAEMVRLDERPILLLRSVDGRSCEARGRISLLIARFEATIHPSRSDLFPLIDCLSEGRVPNSRRLVRECLLRYGEYQDMLNDYANRFACWRCASRDMAIELSRRGWSRRKCVCLLDDMIETEIAKARSPMSDWGSYFRRKMCFDDK